MAISWYPGHMHKANKEMAALIKDIDVVIEVLDARMPQASSNPLLQSMRQGKPCLRILNKADLANPHITRDWLDHFNREPLSFAASSAKDKRIETADVLYLCQKLMRKANAGKPAPVVNPTDNTDVAALRAWKQEHKKQQILIVGIPNVGKSSILNQMIGKKIARTGNEPAITKGQQRVVAHLMKMLGVFFKAVIRREVHTAAKPSHGFAVGGRSCNHAHIHVHGRHIGVAGVKHQGHAHGFKRCASQLGAMLRGRGRQLGATHM